MKNREIESKGLFLIIDIICHHNSIQKRSLPPASVISD